MNRELVLGEWERAVQTLRAAELLTREGYTEDAVSRTYYAVLHAARAALCVCAVVTESHAGVRRMFGKHLIPSGAIEREWAKYLGESLDDRLAADYDIGTSYSSEQAREECGRADEFLERIHRYLLDNGLTERELSTE